MKSITIVLIVLGSWIAPVQHLTAQEIKPDVDTYFAAGLQTMNRELLWALSLPTLEECEKIFKPESAREYFEYTQEFRTMIAGHLVSKGVNQLDTARHAKFKVDIFTMEDIRAGKQNYAGGMAMIMDHYLPELEMTFYRVLYMKTEADTSGIRYNNFVYLDDKWVFMPKPWRALRN